jgi:hypothetical protein
MSAPSVNAGPDQTITDSQVLVLVGTVTPGTYPVDHVQWTLVSGPDCAMTAATSWINQVYELYAGTYVFQFAAYDQLNSVGTDTVSITVSHDTGPIYIPNGPSSTNLDWFPNVQFTLPLDLIQK